MARSLKKGPFADASLLKKVDAMNASANGPFFNERAIIYLLFCQSPLHTAVCFLGLRTSCLLYQRLPEEASKTSPGFPIFYYFFKDRKKPSLISPRITVVNRKKPSLLLPSLKISASLF